MFDRKLAWTLVLIFAAVPSLAAAQEHRHAPVPNSAHAVDAGGTSVQLPSFNFFTISTSVMVPDRGTMMLGGVGAGSSANHQNGGPLFSQGAGGSTLGGGGMSVGVQVHDLKEMDRQLLAGAAGTKLNDGANQWAVRIEEARKSSAGRPTISVAEARRLRESGSAR